MTKKTILSVKNLKVQFPIRVGGILRVRYKPLRAVDGVSFDLNVGESLGVVGESGCGKSTLGRASLLLTRPTEGQVYWHDEAVEGLSDKELREKRQDFQLVFQDPVSSLNPRMTVFEIVAEPLRSFQPNSSKEELKTKVIKAMETVGLLPNMMMRYPHEFSGGQCQRISIARAIILNPKALVLDEPVSALDVSIQAQITNLLKELKKTLGLSYFFISHDLSVVRYLCDRVLVMYLGKIVEVGERDNLFAAPRHPYTQALISAIPLVETRSDKSMVAKVKDIELPSPINPPSGCRFHTRCPHATNLCREQEPQMEEISSTDFVACHNWRDVT